MKFNGKIAFALIALSGALVLFQNCSSGGSLTLEKGANSLLGQQVVAHAPTASELEGSWLGPCEPAPANTFIRMTLNFAVGGTATVAASGYSDAACTTQVFIDTYALGFVLASSTVANSGRINLTLTSAQRAPAGAANATAFNTAMMCGQTGWVANTAKSIAPGTSCLLFTTISSTILGVDGTKLYFGNDADTALDPARVYNKQ